MRVKAPPVQWVLRPAAGSQARLYVHAADGYARLAGGAVSGLVRVEAQAQASHSSVRTGRNAGQSRVEASHVSQAHGIGRRLAARSF